MANTKKRANLLKALEGNWNSNSKSNSNRKRAGNTKIPVHTKILMNEMWKKNTSRNNRERERKNATMKPSGFGFNAR